MDADLVRRRLAYSLPHCEVWVLVLGWNIPASIFHITYLPVGIHFSKTVKTEDVVGMTIALSSFTKNSTEFNDTHPLCAEC